MAVVFGVLVAYHIEGAWLCLFTNAEEILREAEYGAINQGGALDAFCVQEYAAIPDALQHPVHAISFDAYVLAADGVIDYPLEADVARGGTPDDHVELRGTQFEMAQAFAKIVVNAAIWHKSMDYTKVAVTRIGRWSEAILSSITLIPKFFH